MLRGISKAAFGFFTVLLCLIIIIWRGSIKMEDDNEVVEYLQAVVDVDKRESSDVFRDQKRAYVALCTSKRYIFPTLVLFHQIRRVSAIDMVVLLSTDLRNLSFLFTRVRITVIFLPSERLFTVNYPVQSISTRKRDINLWYKLYAWKLDYEKIIFLDVDLLVLENIDELFDLNVELAGVAALSSDEKILFWDPPGPLESDPVDINSWRNFSRVSELEVYHSGLNSGVILLKPSAEIYHQLLTAASLLAERTCCPSQEFVFRFFELRGTYHRLPPTYNMRKIHKISYEDANSQVKVYHFVEKKKPWMIGRSAAKNFKYARLWWDAAEKADNFLESTFSNEEELLAAYRSCRHAAISWIG